MIGGGLVPGEVPGGVVVAVAVVVVSLLRSADVAIVAGLAAPCEVHAPSVLAREAAINQLASQPVLPRNCRACARFIRREPCRAQP
jgi:hypothetical protein